ncbi:MSMEG_1061 family FMN-dependent PPOX-type flavoprotein [Embleya sp. NPDC050154]|uniref:MSMEG_1061 family FMN-dependent PPOX-type flavoprotein n=1 Tax=Embleya sp. NPDC050154 TaxID=3363988 RepID=UPI0037B7E140
MSTRTESSTSDDAAGAEGRFDTGLFDALRADAIADVTSLRELYEQPGAAAAAKEMDRLTEKTRALVGCASLVFVASTDAQGRCDVTPRGGPAGFVTVLDDRTLVIPDATGNKRLDTLHNVLETGRVGLLFVIPGRTTTLRANGRACVSARPELLEQLTPVGKPPVSALVVEVDEVYPHCPKALLRSSAWKPEGWLPADAQPSSAEVTLAQLRMPGLTIEDIRQAEADSLKYRYE